MQLQPAIRKSIWQHRAQNFLAVAASLGQRTLQPAGSIPVPAQVNFEAPRFPNRKRSAKWLARLIPDE